MSDPTSRGGRAPHAEGHGKVRRILVVCTGNICRSPLAEAFLQRSLLARSQRDVWVESAGTAGFRGLPATQGMIDFARSIGLDLSYHRSSPLLPEKIAESDLILCMEDHHRSSVLKMMPSAASRTVLLTHFLEPPQRDTEIPDPHGGSRSELRTAGERVTEARRVAVSALEKKQE